MWWLTVFLAQAAEPGPQDEGAAQGEEAPNYEEMIVTATRTTRAAELALNAEIRELGYLPGVTFGGRTQYISAQVWKPRITVYHAGFVEVRGRRVTPMAPLSEYGLPGASGVWQNKRETSAQEDRVRRGVEGEVRDWQDALRSQALMKRQLVVRNTCVMLWEGQEQPEVRRESLAALWLNTSDTAEGAIIRGVVLNYIDEVVQESASPYLPEELERINDAHSFGQPFEPMEP